MMDSSLGNRGIGRNMDMCEPATVGMPSAIKFALAG